MPTTGTSGTFPGRGFSTVRNHRTCSNTTKMLHITSHQRRLSKPTDKRWAFRSLTYKIKVVSGRKLQIWHNGKILLRFHRRVLGFFSSDPKTDRRRRLRPKMKQVLTLKVPPRWTIPGSVTRVGHNRKTLLQFHCKTQHFSNPDLTDSRHQHFRHKMRLVLDLNVPPRQ